MTWITSCLQNYKTTNYPTKRLTSSKHFYKDLKQKCESKYFVEHLPLATFNQSNIVMLLPFLLIQTVEAENKVLIYLSFSSFFWSEKLSYQSYPFAFIFPNIFSWLPLLLVFVPCFLLYFAFQESQLLALSFPSSVSWIPRANSKVENLLLKIFSLKQKKLNTSSYNRNYQILPLSENSLMFLQTIISSFV